MKLIGTSVQLFLADTPQFEECRLPIAALPPKSINAFRLALKSSGGIVSAVRQLGESPSASYSNNKLFVFIKWREAVF